MCVCVGGGGVRGREARGAGGGRGWGLKRRRAYSLHKESIGCINPATTASVPLCKFNRGRELSVGRLREVYSLAFNAQTYVPKTGSHGSV